MATITTLFNKRKSYLWNVFRENKIFVLFSFLSCSLPIIYCLLASLIKPDGSQAVMAIGHVMPFLLAFMQIAFTISMIIFAKLREIKDVKTKYDGFVLTSSAIWMSFLIGIISSVFYVISTFCYMYFSNNRPNTQAMLNYGLQFTWVTIPFTLLFPLFISLIFIIRKNNVNRALLLIFSFFIVSTFFSYIFGIATNLKGLGLGLGLSIGLLFSLFINIIYINKWYLFNLFTSYIVFKNDALIFRIIFKESITSISLSVFKGIAIICLSFTIPNTINGFVPLSYQMSRVIWFNMMYFIPFIGIGIGEGIRYHYLSKHSLFSESNCYLEHRWKNDMKLIYLSFGLTTVIAISCIFLVQPLNYLYTKNDFNTFKDGKMPEIVGWGQPDVLFVDFRLIDFNKFKDLNIPDFPKLLPTNTGNSIIDAINSIKNIQMVKDWLNQTIEQNPQAAKEIIDSLKEVQKLMDWFGQKNISGQTLINFLDLKYKTNILEGIKEIISGNQPSKEFLNSIQSIMSYFVYLWLYSSTSSIVTDSFLLLRSFIHFNDVLVSSNGNIITALINNPFSNVLTSLFLKINTFEAKAIIYVAVYGVLNSVWSILIQVNQRNEKKGMPYWLLTIIYGVCVGFLVIFGTLFAVTFKDKLGSNNPFNYLDAWTFPLIVISFAVIIVLSIKCFVSYKKLQKERNKIKNVEIY